MKGNIVRNKLIREKGRRRAGEGVEDGLCGLHRVAGIKASPSLNFPFSQFLPPKPF